MTVSTRTDRYTPKVSAIIATTDTVDPTWPQSVHTMTRQSIAEKGALLAIQNGKSKDL